MSDLLQFQKALEAGFLPDLDLTVDEWSDRFMIIPKSTGSNEYGAYKTERTPHAREIMLCLSDDHKCKTVVAKVASQMFKTQICLNWFGSTVHQSPSNFLWLMPTGKLHKRIAGRIDKTIKAVDVLRERVAKPNSRDAMNNQDTKEYIGGTLFIATAGSAANLSEVPARRVAIDEVDRGEENVDGEGDPVKLAEARQTTFEHNRKSYYYSSPTIEEESRIDELFKQGTQRHALAECVHCGHTQELIFEKLFLSENDEALYPCKECGGLHKESDKTKMFANGLWSDGVENKTTESFTASAMYLPYGWKSWRGLMRDYEEAKKLLDAGDESEMIVFYNTRLARCWERKKEATKYDALMARAEDYRLGTVPDGVMVLTAAIDTQADRLELKVAGWGRDMECWIVDYRVIIGDPSDNDTWKQAYETLVSDFSYASGSILNISTSLIDSGGHHTQEVYNFVRRNKSKKVFAIKGESVRNRPIIPNRPSNVDFNYKGEHVKKGVVLWKIGTDTAKDYLFSRWKRDKGPGAVRFSNELPEEYYKQLVSEYRSAKYVNGRKKTIWEKKQSDRNEALDLMVYNLAAAYKLGLHRYTQNHWDLLEKQVKIDANERKTNNRPDVASSHSKKQTTLSRGRNLMKSIRGRNGRN
ncbi:phage terminase large subunit family protein [uncultured Paraglaciecola sp.]|uniref:phage terminase large subunit family protein n=1 Tax=uncultured Paraglaciecola sp. TaxID=1765024 RepID=UPI002623D95F|nr:phage terminase large subunit family protein [uncultured Paraglaciecola sp.]